MSLRDLRGQEITSFGGMNLLEEASNVPPTQALVCNNMEFSTAHQVKTRYGFGQAADLSGFTATARMARSMHNWLTSIANKNYLIYQGDSAGAAMIYVLDVTSPSTAPVDVSGAILFSSAAGVSFATYGPHCYYTAFDSAGNGSTALSGFKVVSYNGTTFVVDSPFPIPSATGGAFIPVMTEPVGAGNVTAGAHRFGYVAYTRSGGQSRPSPDTFTPNDGVSHFSPVSFTSAGSKTVLMTVNSTNQGWGSDIAYIQAIMATVANPSQYWLIPDATFTLTQPSTQTATITIDISDSDLAFLGTDASSYFRLYGLKSASALPLSVHQVLQYGPRMCYLTDNIADDSGQTSTGVFISDPSLPQNITADQNLIQLPGNLQIMTMFVYGRSLYLVGPSWTYSVTDNGDKPNLWASPRLVDGRIGTQSIRGVEVAPSGQYGWVCHDSGLYLFSGAYSAIPVSERAEPDWARINWSYRQAVQVKDSPTDKFVAVMVPLDAATTPSHIMIFDYTNGVEPNQIRYSLWSIASSNIGSMAIVQNDLPSQAAGNPRKLELWIGPQTSGSILRRMNGNDTNPYRDYSAQAINSQYRTGFFK